MKSDLTPKPLEKEDICYEENSYIESPTVSIKKLKAACEWYLKHYDNHAGLLFKNEELARDFNKFIQGMPKKYQKGAYNEWLFRRAFRGVLE